MKSTTKLYLILILLTVGEIVRFSIVDTKYGMSAGEITQIGIWTIACAFCYLRFKMPKNRSQFTGMATKVVINVLLSTILVAYLLGLFTGFANNVISTSITSIIKNVVPIIIVVVSKEIIRYIVASNSNMTKKPLVLLTIIYVIVEITEMYTTSSVTGLEGYFIFTCRVVLPAMASQSLLSYLTYNFGMRQSIVYSTFVGVYAYVLPIVPNIGDFIYSVMFLFVPFIILLLTIDIVKYQNKEKESINRHGGALWFIPIFIFLSILVILVTGIFNYKMIAIASGSMSPEFERGDAVIYKKIKNIDELSLGMVIAYRKDKIIVTHRIVKIKESGDDVILTTKGDYNEEEDNYIVKGKEVLGEVKYVVKYVGFPTVWLSENI